MSYLLLKSLHILAVISWMAGILYLPRLFVYHAESKSESEQSETFKVMEKRLMKVIMTPAMLVTWLTGLSMLVLVPGFSGTWLWLKFLLVVLLSVIHVFYARCLKAFAHDSNPYTARFYRIMNEVPALLMVLIVCLVVVKPF